MPHNNKQEEHNKETCEDCRQYMFECPCPKCQPPKQGEVVTSCPKAGQTHYGCGICDKHPKQGEEWIDKFISEEIQLELPYISTNLARKFIKDFYQKGREDVVRAVKKLREGDGKPHNDTRELHEAIVWQEGYNQALDAVLEIMRKV